MERERITYELKYYRSYKAAVEGTMRRKNMNSINEIFENKYMTAAPCRVTLFSDMPMGRGSGSRPPTLTGGMTFDDLLELERYQEMIEMIDIALASLTEAEFEVITLKWMDDLTLNQISDRKGISPRTAKTIHSRALDKLYTSLRFYHPPKIEIPLPLPVA
ncbi:Sigma-70, region 4 [compost metagenome]